MKTRMSWLLLAILLFGCSQPTPVQPPPIDTSAVDRVGTAPLQRILEIRASLLSKDVKEVAALDRVQIFLNMPNDAKEVITLWLRSQRDGQEAAIIPQSPSLPKGITQDPYGRLKVTPDPSTLGVSTELWRFLDTSFLYLEVEMPDGSYKALRKTVENGKTLPDFAVTLRKESNGKWLVSID